MVPTYGGSAHQSHGAGQRKALSHKVVRWADGIDKREAEAEYGRGWVSILTQVRK